MGGGANREGILVAKWRTFKPADFVVFSTSGHSEWSTRSIVDGVDEFRVSHDLPNGGARVPQKHMTEPTQTDRHTEKQDNGEA